MDDERPKSLEPKAAPKSSVHSKSDTDDKYYGKGKSMSERFRNFVTGGAQDTLDKAKK